MKKLILSLLILLSLTSDLLAGTQICSRGCRVFGFITAGYAWRQPDDIPCGQNGFPGSWIHYTIGHMDRGKFVVIDHGVMPDARGMEC